MEYSIHRFAVVDSTNRLAAAGKPGDVFVAAEQTAGRGRLDHKWHSRAGENLLTSVVIDVSGIAPAEVATLPLVVGLAVVKAIDSLCTSKKCSTPQFLTSDSSFLIGLKWPNDVYIGTRKVCGILCERHGDNVVAGIGINVRQTEFPDELISKATSLVREGIDVTVDDVLDALLESLTAICKLWVRDGFAALHSEFAAVDFLKGREVTVMRTDDDASPLHGICNGISDDGSLLVNSERVYAGEVRLKLGTKREVGLVDIKEVARYMKAGGKELSDGLRARIETLIAEAPIDTRGVWRAEADTIYLCGTIGSRFDQWQRRLSVMGATDALIAQAIGAAAVEAVMDSIEAEAKAATPGEWDIRRSPGYGATPLGDSAKILEKLDATKRIGVACTGDFLLVPTKSVTATCSRRRD